MYVINNCSLFFRILNETATKTGKDSLGNLDHVMCSADQAITERNSNIIRDNTKSSLCKNFCCHDPIT